MTLERGEVHLWMHDLDRAPEPCDGLEDLLSPAEVETAARFRHADYARRYVTRRGTLRRLLGRYLAAAPGDVPIEPGPRGRPRLGEAARGTGIDFNLSSSDGLCLYALARGTRVGVDLERTRAEVDIVAIARRAFGPEEAERLARLAPEAGCEAFYPRWVAAEAALKLTGEGIGGLDRGARRRDTGFVTPVDAPPGYVAALATGRPLPEKVRAPAFTGARPLTALRGPVVLRLGELASSP